MSLLVPMDLSAPKPDEAAEEADSVAASGPVKFLYPSGARPLDGYTIKRGIGRGGFGEVYFATSDAGKEVALKLVRRNLDVELRGVTHCLNLKHPNLISVYDIRADSVGDQWVVMEYVSGESLQDALERNPNGLPPEEIARWMHGIGAGVSYLHDHGIVHRDLKPGNVFLDDDSGNGGVVKLGDYGLSKFISCSRRSGQTESVGTVHYMAPEIANGRYGREIDTYALGIMLYEMLTGHVPFDGESVGEVLMKHLTAEPDLSRVEEPYREIVRRTLAKDPELRIGSVQELLSMLPGASTDQPQFAQKLESWTNEHAAADGIGGRHEFSNTAVRGVRGEASTPTPETPGRKEPLYDWLSTSWSGAVDSWHAWPLNPVGKALLLFVLVGLTVVSVPFWGQVVVPLAFVYLFYYLFWVVFVRPAAAPAPRAPSRRSNPNAETAIHPKQPKPAASPPAQPPTRRQRVAALRRKRTDWRTKVNRELAAKPARDKFTEVLTSMVLSGLVCSFLSTLVVMTMAGEAGLAVWMSIVSTFGSWIVLGVSKFTEGRFEDQIPARSSMMLGGAALGLLAALTADALLIGIPQYHDFGIDYHDSLMVELFELDRSAGLQKIESQSVLPSTFVTVIHFAAVFALIRWWRLADYTRRTRLSLVSLGTCVCGAWLASLVFWYPQPGGMAVAGVTAVATQLVSPWLPPSKRQELQESLDEQYTV